MTENVKDLIKAIAAGDALGTEQAFNATMADKISAKLDGMRVEVAKGMFTGQEEVAEVSAEVDTVEVTSETDTEE